MNDYLAVERTSLAWIRTGLAMMGFGFVVARFGLFLKAFEVSQHASMRVSTGLSLWFGTALIGVGVLVNLYSGWRHAVLVRRLERGDNVSRNWMQATIVAALLVVVGSGMALYLMLIRNPIH